MPTLGAVVIHHRNFPGVLQTVASLLGQDIAPHLFIIVDNSEDPDLAAKLRDSLHANIDLHCIPNLGYGNAANFGVKALSAKAPDLDYVLISTHETIPAAGAVSVLQDALDRDPGLAVVGPALVSVNKDGRQVYWSRGGRLTRLLNEPRHIGLGTPVEKVINDQVEPRAWVDGAFCLYRAKVLRISPFREDFFLYFEETELHTRLGHAGYRIGLAPAATVEQSSNGVPAYFLARNLQRFQRLHGSASQRLFAVPLMILRRVVKAIICHGSSAELRELLRGWRHGLLDR